MDEFEAPGPRMSPVGELLAPTRPTTFGNLFGDTFRIYVRHFIPITLVAGAMFIPIQMIELAHIRRLLEMQDIRAQIKAGTVDWTTKWSYLRTLATFFLAAFVTYIVVQNLSGRRPSLRNALSVGIARALPALLVAICITVMLVAIMISGIMTGIVGLTLVALIPATMVLCAVYVAIPVSVTERPGIMGALSRSFELTKGHRMMILGANILLLMGIGLVSSKVDDAMLKSFVSDRSLASYEAYQWVDTALSTIMLSLMAVLSAVTYHSLRTNKEGVSSEALASVFD